MNKPGPKHGGNLSLTALVEMLGLFAGQSVARDERVEYRVIVRCHGLIPSMVEEIEVV